MLRYIKRVYLYEWPHILTLDGKFYTADYRQQTTLRGDYWLYDDLRQLRWPEPDDFIFQRPGFIKVFMDDIYLCPNCGEWWPEEQLWRIDINLPQWIQWQPERKRELAFARLQSKEFYFAKCPNTAVCAGRRSQNIQKFGNRQIPRQDWTPRPVLETPKRPINEPIVQSFVYLFQMEQFYKIGIATKPKERRRSLQTGSPFKVELLKAWPVDSAREIEAALHERFGTHRKTGEWFNLPEDLVANLLQVENITEFVRQNPAG